MTAPSCSSARSCTEAGGSALSDAGARNRNQTGGKGMWITIDGTSTAGVTRNVPDEGRIGFFVDSGSLIVRSAAVEIR